MLAAGWAVGADAAAARPFPVRSAVLAEGAPGRFAYLLVDPATGRRRRLRLQLPRRADEFTRTPDGLRVVALEPVPEPVGQPGATRVHVRALGSGRSSLLGTLAGDLARLSFSPAGDQAVVSTTHATVRADHHLESGDSELEVIDLRSGARRTLLSYPPVVRSYAAGSVVVNEDSASGAWAPDGSLIAFSHVHVRYADGAVDRSELGVMVPDGSSSRVLSDEGADRVGDMAWAPDSQTIAFDTATGAVLTIGRDGSGRTIVAARGGPPQWSPSGRYLAFPDEPAGTGTTPHSLVVVDMHTGLRHHVRLRLKGLAYNYTWAPARDELVIGERGGLYLVRPNGRTVRRLVAGNIFPVTPGSAE